AAPTRGGRAAFRAVAAPRTAPYLAVLPRPPCAPRTNLEQTHLMLTHMKVRGACEHNLKGVDVDLPRDSLVVITGLSGSGKSSLAFDAIYAEGQRRYVESLSAYARHSLALMSKPDVDNSDGLSPAIRI